MTVRFSAPLQQGLYDLLSGYGPLAAENIQVFDEAPHRSRGGVNDTYITIGDEVISPWNTGTDLGATHDATLRVCAPQRGFIFAKSVAALVHDALTSFAPLLSVGRVVRHDFVSAKTEREAQGALRRIDLTFRFVIEDDATT
ncbi:MAG: DUF3168 domain-containing protein [Pikeienuella sp.]